MDSVPLASAFLPSYQAANWSACNDHLQVPSTVERGESAYLAACPYATLCTDQLYTAQPHCDLISNGDFATTNLTYSELLPYNDYDAIIPSFPTSDYIYYSQSDVIPRLVEHPPYNPRNLPQTAEQSIRTHDSGPRAQCKWGTSCAIALDDLSPSGINRHLKEYHFHDEAVRWHDRDRGACNWSDWGLHCCGRMMNYASFGKHIASVHLRSTAKQCPYCFHELGRADSLDRHIKLYCPRNRHV
ncbi:hypothetical protein AcV5_000261 [Taiwanofungus camphoratus]|nr:hypothetical protein AcV5_000261 [Antrodia cinnamomea]